MINLFVGFGFQALNIEALLAFELIQRRSIINNFESRNITILLTIFRRTKMLENMSIFIPEKVLIYTCVEMAVGFTNVASTTARTSRYTTRDDRAYKINNTTQGFQNDINTLTTILKRNMFPSWLIDRSFQGYHRNVTTKEAPK